MRRELNQPKVKILTIDLPEKLQEKGEKYTTIKCHNYATARKMLNKYTVTYDNIYEMTDYLNRFYEWYLLENNYGYFVTKDAPNNWEALKEYKENNVIPVFAGGGNHIYRSDFMNYNFRAMHDFCHLITGGDFSYGGESKAIRYQYNLLEKELSYILPNLRKCIVKIFLADTIGQVEYYYKTKEFLKDQKQYVITLTNNNSLEDLLSKIKES